MKGLFIPGITAEMFRNGCLESIEALMAKGEIYDIEYYPKAENEKEDVLDKIKAEIDRQEKWLMSAGCNAYNVDIAFNSIKSVLSESEE